MSESSRQRALAEDCLLHPQVEAVGGPLFAAAWFFLAADEVQVKYEMLCWHAPHRRSATEAAAAHRLLRARFFLAQAAFERSGKAGLLNEKRGRYGPGEADRGDRRVVAGAEPGVGRRSRRGAPLQRDQQQNRCRHLPSQRREGGAGSWSPRAPVHDHPERRATRWRLAAG